MLPMPNSCAAGLCHSPSVGAALEMFGSSTWLLLPCERFLLCFHSQFWNVSQMVHKAPEYQVSSSQGCLPPSQLSSRSAEKNFTALCIVPLWKAWLFILYVVRLEPFPFQRHKSASWLTFLDWLVKLSQDSKLSLEQNWMWHFLFQLLPWV